MTENYQLPIELDHAHDLLESAFSVIQDRINKAQDQGDRVNLDKYQSLYNQVRQDYKTLIKDSEYRRVIIDKYPKFIRDFES